MVGILMTNALPIGGSWGLMAYGSQRWPRMGELRLILDPASAMRSFYFDKQDARVLFGDIREKESHLLCNGQTIHIQPDEVMDFRSIPYPDESFQCVVFDPPHLFNLSEKSWMRKKYGVLDKETWRDDITRGFSECFQVLKSNGTLIFKWNETSIPTKDVMALTEYKAVLGHPSGKRMGTHWLLYIKTEIGDKNG